MKVNKTKNAVIKKKSMNSIKRNVSTDKIKSKKLKSAPPQLNGQVKPQKLAKPLEKIKSKKLKKLNQFECNGKTKKPKTPARSSSDIESKKKVVKKDAIKDSQVNDEKSNNKNKGLSDAQLKGLKDIDPEFYDFLKKNDKKLLEFNLLDSDSDFEDETDDEPKLKKKKINKSDDDDEDDSDREDEKFHKPIDELEVASDESDFEGEDDDDEMKIDGTQKVTLNLLRHWQMALQKPNVPIDVVRNVIQAFSSALASITPEAENAPTAFKVVGSAAFNGIIQLCVLHLQPAILRIVGLKNRSNIPLHKTKKWTRVRGCLRYYLSDLINLIQHVSSANILCILLKHLHQMAGMIGSFTSLGKTILKRLIVLWATEDETVRVLAFLCILKITRSQQVSMLNHVLKAMYLSYVRNSKFVSPNTLPSINFMRRSLVEMFALDLNVSYQHAFLYTRQLAIHLRNAVILKKKDSFQAVYNWQFVNSLRLWAELLGATANKPQLQPLVYPLVTIIIGVIRLIPTAQYFPLRFHCLQALISLAKATDIFIPVLPLILEVLHSNTFNKKHSAVSMRPLQFTCILRLNKTQLTENGFRDEVVENVCGLTLEFLAYESSSLAFSDLVVPTILALKSYLKNCHNSNHSRKLKTLLDKIQENAKFIDQERQKITFALKDFNEVKAWETRISNKGTPLSIYYDSWVKTHEMKKRRQAAQTDSINDSYDLPTIKRTKGVNVAVKNENGEVELFPSDTEDETAPEVSVDDTKKATKSKKETKKKTKKQKNVEVEPEIPIEEPEADDVVDIVKDLDLNDW